MSLLNKIARWVKAVLTFIPKGLKQKAAVALLVTNALNKAANNQPVNIRMLLADLKLDSTTISILLLLLDEIAVHLMIDNKDFIPAFLISLGSRNRKSELVKIMSDIIAALDNKELKECYYDTVAQVYYASTKVV